MQPIACIATLLTDWYKTVDLGGAKALASGEPARRGENRSQTDDIRRIWISERIRILKRFLMNCLIG